LIDAIMERRSRAGVEKPILSRGNSMSDTDFRRETDADLTPPPATAVFTPAEPLKTSGVGFASAAGQDLGADGEALPASDGIEASSQPVGTKQAIRESGTKIAAQATDKARLFADQGKAKAGEKLDQFSQMLTDAATTVDEKLGGQYGQYARTAADQVTNFSNSLKAKDVDELVEDVRGFVRASPAMAIGVAAAVGFALARVVQSGIESGTGTPKA
jgi:ElaB/YqjD/DUF883 family membrane-anchored ribosome-binding protein